MDEAWLMLAFPGGDVGKYALRAFAPSKNGKSWFRILPTREAAIVCKRELVDAGLRYACKKIDKPPPRPRSGPHANLKSAQLYQEQQARRNAATPGIAAENVRQFADYKRDMQVEKHPETPLPEPIDGPVFGRSPGLSKSGPIRRA
jgi:hypothetical protein